MAFNGSGTFVRVYSFATDKTNLVPVTASRMDGELDGIATGLSTAIAKDGQTPTTARIPFASGTSAVAGSTSGVSYSFTSDPNTGVYSPATDQVALVAGGTATLTSTATTVTVPVDLVVTGSVTGVFASGTKMIFYQASAPTGWTAVAQNDKALRVVSAGGTGGTAGGTNAFSTVMAQSATGSHTLVNSELPITTPTFTGDSAVITVSSTVGDILRNPSGITGSNTGGGFGLGTGSAGGQSVTSNTTYQPTGAVSSFGGGGGHTHTLTMAMQYCDVIICSKD